MMVLFFGFMYTTIIFGLSAIKENDDIGFWIGLFFAILSGLTYPF